MPQDSDDPPQVRIVWGEGDDFRQLISVDAAAMSSDVSLADFIAGLQLLPAEDAEAPSYLPEDWLDDGGAT